MKENPGGLIIHRGSRIGRLAGAQAQQLEIVWKPANAIDTLTRRKATTSIIHSETISA
jgi:hypothetical protein